MQRYHILLSALILISLPTFLHAQENLKDQYWYTNSEFIYQGHFCMAGNQKLLTIA
jgi:hypothetical protein